MTDNNKAPDANDILRNEGAAGRPDVNDTLRSEGPEGVRARLDRAARYNGSGGSEEGVRAVEPDMAEAQRFLRALDPTAVRFTFQTFDDSVARRKGRGDDELRRRVKIRDPLATIFHGTLEQHWPQLAELHRRGAGIFVTINTTNLQGRTKKDIIKVRAVFVDLDGSPLEPVLAHDPPPHIVVESSPGRFHAYWRVGDVPLDRFAPAQKMLAARLGGDPAVRDLPRVMRLPGFCHQKTTSAPPFATRVIKEREGIYSLADFPEKPELEPRGEGGKWAWLNTAAIALDNQPRWVPDLFPGAVLREERGYRVPPAARGRPDLEEDISITADGIVDFGVADQGDPREGRRTAIDLVAEFGKKTFDEAVTWLREKLGIAPNWRDLPPPSAPTQVARLFVRQRHTHENGAPTLRYWRGAWWEWKTTHWTENHDRVVEAELYWFTEEAAYLTKGERLAWLPNRRKIGDLLGALAAVCIMPDDLDQPCWLDGQERSGAVVATASGLLDVETEELLPHTPNFFNQTSVPFAYDPNAPDPARWSKFLGELWPDQPPRPARPEIKVLAQWAGYVISGRTNLHKIFLTVGPKRSGKSTIARILAALVGRSNVAGPTLDSLAGTFGLEPLIGKPLAIIADARLSGRDINTVVERLLSMSGEDPLDVHRKNRTAWTGRLPCRLHIISNELPKLSDASGAVVDRMIMLLLSRSWLGREDYDLEPALLAELPGILNWALAGLRSLIENKNRFDRVPEADEAIRLMHDLASPVGAFVRERCCLDNQQKVGVDELYANYKRWADTNGHRLLAKSTFGRDLRAAVPSIRAGRPRKQEPEPEQAAMKFAAAEREPESERRPRIYLGIGLTTVRLNIE